MKILLVDDDDELLVVLEYLVRRAGYETLRATSCADALAWLEEEKPDLVVLDVRLADCSGFDLIRGIRARINAPIMMLSALGAEEDRVTGLELGADDYVVKPFGHREIVARVHALIRGRRGAVSTRREHRVRVGDLTLDMNQHRVYCNGTPIDLTVTELRVLRYLMARAGETVHLEDILLHVWGDTGPADVVRTTVSRLRRKLQRASVDPRVLRTVRGVGVLLEASEEESDGASR